MAEEVPFQSAPADEPDVLEAIERRIAALEAHPDAEVREAVRTLLEGIDAVHRTGLARLVEALRAMAGPALLNRLVADPAVRLLLVAYDLVPADRRLQAEEALDRVRGPLHDHGIDIEIADVIGGVVSVRVHGLEHARPAGGRPAPDPDAVRRTIEEALQEGLVGFQQVEIAGIGQPVRFVRPARPEYRRVAAAGELPPGSMRAVEVAGEPVLVANLGGDFHAIADRCGTSPLPLRFGRLDGAELHCSWHGCRYDVRTGRRLDAPEADPVPIYPVTVRDGAVFVAVGGTPPSPPASRHA
ncbi:MAG TPA: Rieske 2Fe-2S domain-containing protein [Vicinamibacterales bacterium]|nr:Rieske 2Fe-2S domain-containing protein [Vicinamibacterales bacterium]